MRARRIRALAMLVGLAVVIAAAITFAVRDDGDPAAGRPASGRDAPTDPAPASQPSTSPTTGSSPSISSGFDIERARDAVTYARRHDMDSSIAVIDTRSGTLAAAGDPAREYVSASVIKTMIATRVLLEGNMSGRDATLAYLMITRSDNDAAYALYPQVGGDGLLPWIARHYRIDDLGDRPAHPGLWGSTRITAAGMAHFLTAVRTDPVVWPWLSHAMHHHQPTTTGGEPNDFGLAALASPAAVKNGWNVDDDPKHPGDADINSIGFVDHDRYAVIILSRGPGNLYFVGGERVVTREARLLFPAGSG